MKRGLAALLGLIMLVAFAGCTERVNASNAGPLISFEYNFGSFHGGEWNYKIIQEDGDASWRFTALGRNGIDMDVDTYIGAEVMLDLMDIINENNIYAWNGYDERDPSVLDGYSFNLTAEFLNGTIIAHGYERYPRNYDVGHRALLAYLQSLADKS